MNLMGLSISRLKKSGVRCFAANASDPGFPVRYMPKKRADANQSQDSTSRDGSAKDVGVHNRSDSHHHGCNYSGKASNIRNQKSSTGLAGNSNHGALFILANFEFFTVIKRKFYVMLIDIVGMLNFELKVPWKCSGFSHDIEGQQVKMGPLEEAVEELQTRQGSFRGQCLPCSQQISYSSKAPGSGYIEMPKEILQELQIYQNSGQGHWSEVNQEISCYDGAIDSEYMEASEEIVEEIRISERGGQGKQGRLKSCRTKQDAEKLAVELLAKR